MISKSKIKDTTKSPSDFIYKKIKHNSSSLICEHCKYEKAETSLTIHLKIKEDNDTKKVKGKNTTRKITIVKRGRLDDVIGWVTLWQ